MLDRRGSRTQHPAGRGALAAVALLLAVLVAAPVIAQEPPPDPTPAVAQDQPAAVVEPPEPPEAPEPPEPPEAPEPPEPPEATEPPEAPEPPRVRTRRTDAQVIVGSSMTIEADEVTDDVVVVGGDLLIEGEVVGDAVAIGGRVVVEGTVSGDVSSVGGHVKLGPNAEVRGDAKSFGGKIEQAEGARIDGQVIEVSGTGLHLGLWPGLLSGWNWNHRHEWTHVDYRPWSWIVSQTWWIFCLIVLALFACGALLVARTPVRRIGRRVSGELWQSALVGLLAQLLFVPLLVMVIVFLAISIIGIPFLILVPFALLALCLLVFFGFVGVCLELGEFLAERFSWRLKGEYAALLVGLAALHVWLLVGSMLEFDGPPVRMFAALFTLFGVFVCFVAWTLAVGGVVLTRFGTAEGWGKRTAPPAGAAAPPAQLEAPPAPPAPPPTEEPWEPEIDAGDDEPR